MTFWKPALTFIERKQCLQRHPNKCLPLFHYPIKFDLIGNLAHDWKRFKSMWENYEIASGLNDMGNEKRVATFLTCLGSDGIEIYDSLPLLEAEKSDMKAILEKFHTFCIGETNKTYERYKFNSRNQEPEETFDSYLSALRTLAKTCNFGTLEANLIRDRIVIVISDNSTK